MVPLLPAAVRFKTVSALARDAPKTAPAASAMAHAAMRTFLIDFLCFLRRTELGAVTEKSELRAHKLGGRFDCPLQSICSGDAFGWPCHTQLRCLCQLP